MKIAQLKRADGGKVKRPRKDESMTEFQKHMIKVMNGLNSSRQKIS